MTIRVTGSSGRIGSEAVQPFDAAGPMVLGVDRDKSASVLDCIDLLNEIGGYELKWIYKDENRSGDHICYISDLSKLKRDDPEWSIKRSLRDVIREMIEAEATKLAGELTATVPTR